jgi:hypothetical protein
VVVDRLGGSLQDLIGFLLPSGFRNLQKARTDVSSALLLPISRIPPRAFDIGRGSA